MPKIIFGLTGHEGIPDLEWEQKSINVVLCSHVLQHAHTEYGVKDIL